MAQKPYIVRYLYTVLYIGSTSNVTTIAATIDNVKADIIANNARDRLKDIGEDESRVIILETVFTETSKDIAAAVNKFISEF